MNKCKRGNRITAPSAQGPLLNKCKGVIKLQPLQPKGKGKHWRDTILLQLSSNCIASILFYCVNNNDNNRFIKYFSNVLGKVKIQMDRFLSTV